MAERKKNVKAENVQEGEVVADESEDRQKSTAWPVVTISVFAGVLVLAFVVVCWWAIVFAYHAVTPPVQGGGIYERSALDEEGRELDRQERFERRSGAALSGVVTAIDGDTVTVSGRGKQVTVTRTDDTVIGGDKDELAVNDTVIVYGDTKDDDSVTASRILIRNETSSERGGHRGDVIRKPDA